MTKREEYESRTEKLMLPIVEEMNFELVDVEYVKEGGNYFLRAYTAKEGGTTTNDCETVSRRLSDLLDEADFIPDSYILEVSSPGLGRPLKKDKDFARSIGKKVEIRLFQAVNRNKEFTGVLSAYDKDSVTITQEDSEVIIIPRSGIALIRLALDI